MRYLPKALVLAALVSVQVAVGTIFSAGTITSLYSGRIIPGVWVGNLSAAGLEPSSLQRAAEKVFPADTAGLTLVLHDGGQKWNIPYASLGATSNLDLLLTKARLDNGSAAAALDVLRSLGRPVRLQPGFLFQAGLLTPQLAQINRRLAVPPRDASLTLTGDKVTLVPAKPGRQLDIPAMLRAIGPVLSPEGQVIPVIFAATAPRISDAQLTPLDNLLAAFHTDLNPAQGDRDYNISLAARLLDGTLLQPGEDLSLNTVLGPRAEARGFRPAPAIVNYTLVRQTGGGVCQVASTLYNAALQAGLKVLVRHPHTLEVPYVPLGLDATINWDNLDLKLADNTGHPVYITAAVRDNRLTVRIFGERKESEQVSVYTKITPAFPLPPANQLALGADGQNTIGVAVYRKISRPDGRTTTELISQDYFHAAKNLPTGEK